MGRQWASAVVTSIIVNLFEHHVIILVKEGFLSFYMRFISNCSTYIAEIGQNV